MKADEQTLCRLMALAQKGDRQAYAALLAECMIWLRRYFRNRIAPAQLDDLVQEVLLSLHRKLASYDPAQPFLPWLAAIARYRWIDQLRRGYRLREVPVDDHGHSADDVEQEVASARISLERLFEQLPEGQARAIRLVKIDGQSVSEAARLCGQSESLVKVNIHRGLRRLSALVEKAG
ncbi:MAG TPA: sigma-70 family RNA polymerase sigma factor [Sphingomonadaceae bacterium]|nr:sigma-70 family RNA polymerase sigma factor [Sphingomonadaceae bacterium]